MLVEVAAGWEEGERGQELLYTKNYVCCPHHCFVITDGSHPMPHPANTHGNILTLTVRVTTIDALGHF